MNLSGLFANASSFAQVCKMTKDESLLLVPSVVNGAFACELYLKGLLMLQGYTLEDLKKLPTPQQHNLSDLYGFLLESTKEYLENSVIDKITCSKNEFSSYLSDIATAFVDWRYGYEDQSVSISNDNAATRIKIYIKDMGVNTKFLDEFISCLHDLSDKKICEKINE